MPMIPARPAVDPTGTGATAVPVDGGRWHAVWAWITAQVDAIPAWSWAIALGVLTLATIVLIPLLQTQSYKAGQRAAGKKGPTSEDRKDRRLLIGALIPTVSFWIAVLFGSGRGLIAFGRDDLKWTGGWEFLVPATLDGVAISFGLLAFRAIRKGRSPDRAVRIAASAMLSSSAINFLHEVGGSKLGAGYLAILSLLGMLIFDELLAQFEEGAAYIKRQYPKFGLRWLTWPTNTVCAWFAWRNHPLDEDTNASIRLAVEHLETIRRKKAAVRASKVDAPAWWMAAAPWLRINQLGTALTDSRTEIAAHVEFTAKLTADLTEITDRLDAVNAANATVKASLQALEEKSENDLAALTDQLTGEHDEVVRKLTADFTAQITEASTVNLNRYREDRPKTSPTRTRKASPQPANRPAKSNEEAVQAMFDAHPDPDFVWSQNAVRTLTGAGFGGRIDTLIAAWHSRALGESDGDQAVNQ